MNPQTREGYAARKDEKEIKTNGFLFLFLLSILIVPLSGMIVHIFQLRWHFVPFAFYSTRLQLSAFCTFCAIL